MSELKGRIRAALNRTQLAGLATLTEDGLPWTRYVMISSGEDLMIRCATFLQARKVAQIRNNPEVHLNCGVVNPTQMNPYLQIQGVAIVSSDRAERHAFWNPTLETIFSGKDDPNYGVVIILPYRVEYWSLGSMQPEVCDLHTRVEVDAFVRGEYPVAPPVG